MKIHEADARGIFAEYGLPVPPSKMITKAGDAKAAAEQLGCPVVVKAGARPEASSWLPLLTKQSRRQKRYSDST